MKGPPGGGQHSLSVLFLLFFYFFSFSFSSHTIFLDSTSVLSLHAPLKKQGGGLNWLFPFVDGAPAVGWHDAGAYLLMPVLLIVSQYASQKLISPQVCSVVNYMKICGKLVYTCAGNERRPGAASDAAAAAPSPSFTPLPHPPSLSPLSLFTAIIIFSYNHRSRATTRRSSRRRRS
jgi:hypothetical protein